jgi:hypothetical protein
MKEAYLIKCKLSMPASGNKNAFLAFLKKIASA